MRTWSVKGGLKLRLGFRIGLPDGGEAEALAECLHDAYVRVFVDEGYGACIVACKVDVCFVDNDDSLECCVIEEGADVSEWDECAGRVSGRADEN